MAFNRLVDRDIDARNPRTAGRELPAGKLSARSVGALVVGAGAVFVGAAWALNPLAGALAPPVLALLLGLQPTSSASAPPRTWSSGWGSRWRRSARGSRCAATLRATSPRCSLAGVVLDLGGGFDLIYACQDADFDRAHGLHSIPARFGVSRGRSRCRGSCTSRPSPCSRSSRSSRAWAGSTPAPSWRPRCCSPSSTRSSRRATSRGWTSPSSRSTAGSGWLFLAGHGAGLRDLRRSSDGGQGTTTGARAGGGGPDARPPPRRGARLARVAARGRLAAGYVRARGGALVPRPRPRLASSRRRARGATRSAATIRSTQAWPDFRSPP